MNIIIADDQCLFREMLKEILELDSELKVLSTSSNGDVVLRALEKHQENLLPEMAPDLMLLDINMPVKSGLDALAEIKSRYPQLKVCLLTTFEDDEKIRQALALGADGYIVKDLRPKALQMAIKCIGEGMVVFHKDIAAMMNYREGTIKNRVSKLLSLTGLSDRIEISVFAVKHQLV